MDIQPSQQDNQNQPQDILPAEPQKSNKKFITVLVIILLILAAGAGAYWYLWYASRINPSQSCPQDAKQCPDGSNVGRTGPNCEFAACPGGIHTESKDCTNVQVPEGSHEADVVRYKTACYLRAGDLENALMGFNESVKDRQRENLGLHDKKALEEMAGVLQNAKLSEQIGNIAIFKKQIYSAYEGDYIETTFDMIYENGKWTIISF